MRKKRILLIDDNSAVLDSLSLILNEEGYLVDIKKSAATIIRDINDFMPNLILLDVMLKGENGIEVAKMLKKTSKSAHIPIILISAASDAKDKLEESHADAFIPKPF